MTKQETAKLLTIISELFPNFNFTMGTVETWAEFLENEDYEQIKITLLVFARSSANAGFAPNAGQLVQLLKKQEQAKLPTAEELFSINCNPDCENTLAMEAFRLWGGRSRQSMLPDPSYHPNPTQAQRDLTFARKELIQIYENLKARAEIKSEVEALDSPNQARIEDIKRTALLAKSV